MKIFARVVPLLLMFAPIAVQASDTTQNVIQIASLFNIIVGLMLTAALLLYFFGMVTWALRLGTWPTYRDEAIHTLMYAVVTLFVLDVLLGIAEFVETHVSVALYFIAIAFILLALWAVAASGALGGGGGGEEEKEH